MSVTSLENRQIAIITGGGGGIGRACAMRFAADGWAVIVADIDLAAAEETAQLTGGEASRLDLASLEDITAFAAEITSRHGVVDALVNSAAWFHSAKPAEDLTSDDWNRTFDVCVRGPYFLSVALATPMAKRGKGSVVNLASTAGVRSAPLHAYAPAKAALINMTECLAAEYGRSGVRFNAVTPSLTATPALLDSIARRERFVPDVERHTSLGRFVEPGEVAEAVYFLASDESSAITGSNVSVDAGSLQTASWQMFGGLRPTTIAAGDQ
ncbi:MAG: SDR family oxidoreductase [Mesorhizobium sp.]